MCHDSNQSKLEQVLRIDNRDNFPFYLVKLYKLLMGTGSGRGDSQKWAKQFYKHKSFKQCLASTALEYINSRQG